MLNIVSTKHYKDEDEEENISSNNNNELLDKE